MSKEYYAGPNASLFDGSYQPTQGEIEALQALYALVGADNLGAIIKKLHEAVHAATKMFHSNLDDNLPRLREIAYEHYKRNPPPEPISEFDAGAAIGMAVANIFYFDSCLEMFPLNQDFDAMAKRMIEYLNEPSQTRQ